MGWVGRLQNNKGLLKQATTIIFDNSIVKSCILHKISTEVDELLAKTINLKIWHDELTLEQYSRSAFSSSLVLLKPKTEITDDIVLNTMN